MEIPKNAYTKAKKDNYNATFKQIVLFDNGKAMTGYSANAGFSEKHDKQAVLINWILRMHKAGYLDLTDTSKDLIVHIEYFLNLVSGQRILLRLYYDYYEVLDPNPNYASVIAFLDDFYADIKRGFTSQQLYSKYYRSDRTKIIDPMDFKFKRFYTLKSLEKFCASMVDKKQFSNDQALYFARKYRGFHNLKN
jgi:hypothetical protein